MQQQLASLKTANWRCIAKGKEEKMPATETDDNFKFTKSTPVANTKTC